MKLQDAIALIQHPGIGEIPNARWADLGCGSGLFGFALAAQLRKGGHIYAVDKNPFTLERLPNPNHISIETIQADFSKDPLPFGELEGILMANALHFVADKQRFIKTAGKYLKKEGGFLLVEYDTDKSNPWVPYPISREQLQLLFANAGYTSFTELGKMPSAYHNGQLYAVFIRQGG